MDVTECRKMEEKLKESEERFKRLIEYAPDAIYINDVNGEFIDGNKQAEALIGYKKEELIRKTYFKLEYTRKNACQRLKKQLKRTCEEKDTDQTNLN